MTYRVSVGGAFYDDVDELEEAQSEALDWARRLTRADRKPASVRVYRMGHPVRDRMGRDATPVFWLGSAVGRLEGRVARVAWVPAARSTS